MYTYIVHVVIRISIIPRAPSLHKINLVDESHRQRGEASTPMKLINPICFHSQLVTNLISNNNGNAIRYYDMHIYVSKSSQFFIYTHLFLK